MWQGALTLLEQKRTRYAERITKKKKKLENIAILQKKPIRYKKQQLRY